MRRVSFISATIGLTLFCFPDGAPAQIDAPSRASTETNREAFDPTSGNSTKCYVVTRDDIEYGEKPGIDPATGRECRPVTAEVIERVRAYKWGNRPKRIESGDLPISYA
jgi:hypothetical protein